MKTKKRIIIQLILFILTVGASVTAAHILGMRIWFEASSEKREKPVVICMNPDDCKLFFCKELMFSEDQHAQFEGLYSELQGASSRLTRQIQEDRAMLVRLLLKTDSMNEVVHAKIEELSSHQKELQLEVADHLLKLKQILSPDQQQDFFNLIGKRMCPNNPNCCKMNCTD